MQAEAMQCVASSADLDDPINLCFSHPYAASPQKNASQPKKLIGQECWRPLAGNGPDNTDVSAELIGKCLDVAYAFKNLGLDYWYLLYFKQELANFLKKNPNFLFVCRISLNAQVKELREHLQSISSMDDYSRETIELRWRFGKIAIAFYAWYRSCTNHEYLFSVDEFFNSIMD